MSEQVILVIVSFIMLFVIFLYLQNEIRNIRESMGALVRASAQHEYQRMFGDRKPVGVTVIIPAYNEAENLKKLLPTIPSVICDRSVLPLVIVDGSHDRSVEVIQKYSIPYCCHLINRGQGDALRTGFNIALQQGTEIVVTMDADGQHCPVEIERLITPIISDEADIVLGTRFSGQYDDKGGMRHAGILFFSAVISFLIRNRISDCANGFRAIRTTSLSLLDLHESRCNAPEIIMKATYRGLRIIEEPVTIKKRASGASKKPLGLRYPILFAFVIFRTWLKH